MSGLPNMACMDSIRKFRQMAFGGYDHNRGHGNGGIWSMENMTSDEYPILSTRPPRYRVAKLERPNGLYAFEALYWVDGETLYRNGEAVAGVRLTDGRKDFGTLGNYLLITPDRRYYNHTTGESGSVVLGITGPYTIRDGTLDGVACTGNAIYSPTTDWSEYFRVGDTVEIQGCAIHQANNKTATIREIMMLGHWMHFDDNTFVTNEAGDAEECVTILRKMPKIQHLMAHENRLWGTEGNTIYCTTPGNLFNWYRNEGTAADSWALEVGSPGPFTGAVSYRGNPIFFKEGHIYKVYGSTPANYQLIDSASIGCEAGSYGSLAIAGETLFYLSRAGIMAYTGSVPANLSEAFGTMRYEGAVAGSDGEKYYVSMRDGSGDWHLFVYDTRRGLWHREDNLHVLRFEWFEGTLYALDADGNLWAMGQVTEPEPSWEREDAIPWFVEWNDFYEYDGSGRSSTADPAKKHLGKLLLRMELDEDASASIEIAFDGGPWETVKELTAARKQSYYLPVIPRRCDHFRIRIHGVGGCRIFSLTREVDSGSENKL